MTGRRVDPPVRDQWSGAGFILDVAHPEQTEHRCSQCFGVYGKSSVHCPNEPETNKEVTP